MNALHFISTFSSGARPQAVTMSTIGVCSDQELRTKLESMEGFAQRSGCPMMSWEKVQGF